MLMRYVTLLDYIKSICIKYRVGISEYIKYY